MKVLFAGGNGYLPQFHGGVQSSTHHLVQQLRRAGHEAAVLAALFGDGIGGTDSAEVDDHLVPGVMQPAGHRFQQIGLLVDEQDLGHLGIALRSS